MRYLLLALAFVAGYATHEVADYYSVKRARMRECESAHSAEFCEEHWSEP